MSNFANQIKSLNFQEFVFANVTRKYLEKLNNVANLSMSTIGINFYNKLFYNINILSFVLFVYLFSRLFSFRKKDIYFYILLGNNKSRIGS